jgi:hypothetical protein
MMTCKKDCKKAKKDLGVKAIRSAIIVLNSRSTLLSMDVQQDTKKSTYDNAKSHFLGDFPASLPIEQAYVHIGIYLGWIIDTTLYSEYFEDEASNQIFRFKRREISCTILSEIWDGDLGSQFFNPVGNMFTYYYYAGGLYQMDYKDILAKDLPTIYHVEDSWQNYEKIKTRMDLRLTDWKKIIKT